MGDIIKKLISDIVVNNRLRSVNREKVRELSDSIMEIGLINPIIINNQNELKAGLHRLEAFKLLGLYEIDVIVLTEQDKLHEELIEIDENLVRSELDYMERGEHLKRRKEIYEELYPESKATELRAEGRRNQLNETVSLSEAKSFSKDTSNKTGLSERAIQQDVQIATVLDDEERKIVKQAELPKRETLKLVQLKKKDPQKATKVIEKIETEKVTKVDVARGLVESDNVKESIHNPKYKNILYTIGYSGKDVEEFVNILKENNISVLIDVRDSGKSIYKPAFESSSIRSILKKHKIEYYHMKEMGVVYEVREPYKSKYINDDAFAGWYKWNVLVRHKEQFMAIMKIVSENNTCLMCSEKYAIPTNDQKHYCHRTLLANELLRYRDINIIEPILKEVIHL